VLLGLLVDACIGGLCAFVEPLEYGQRERSRFASARLSAAEHVFAGQHVRYCLLLDGGGQGVALLANRAKQRLDQTEIFELHQCPLSKKCRLAEIGQLRLTELTSLTNGDGARLSQI
jgi:hypothetical protein